MEKIRKSFPFSSMISFTQEIKLVIIFNKEESTQVNRIQMKKF